MTSCIGFLISMFGTRMCGQTLLFIVIANGAILFPYKEPGCGVACSHIEGLEQLLLFSCFISCLGIFGPRFDPSLGCHFCRILDNVRWSTWSVIQRRNSVVDKSQTENCIEQLSQCLVDPIPATEFKEEIVLVSFILSTGCDNYQIDSVSIRSAIWQ